MTSLLPKLVWHLDEPDADPAAILSYLICQAARENGTTVLLSGTGGDEIFFGYRSHQAYRAYERFSAVPRWLLGPLVRGCAAARSLGWGAQDPVVRRLRKFARGLGADGLQRHLAVVDWSSPQTRLRLMRPDLWNEPAADAPDSMQSYYSAFRGRGELNRHSHMLLQTFLASHNFLYSDKSSMAFSVEVRVPFMDLELMRLCASIPETYQLQSNQTKHLLKKAMAPYLPPEICHRGKTGFMAPLRSWISRDLSEMVGDLLSPARVRDRGMFEPAVVQEIIDDNRNNRADHAYLIYALLNLEIWQQSFIDAPRPQMAELAAVTA
jgi:asparagine synthase (glutamine-hydrolysing)